jgi:hypothetical protein
VTLFALISGSVGLLLRTGMETMNRVNSRIDRTRRFLGAQKALDQILGGLIPTVASCGSSPVSFSGAPAAMRFVTAYSLTEGSRGHLMFVEIFVAEHPEGDGFRLLLNERPYLGRNALPALCSVPIGQSPNSFILADRVERPVFAYRRINAGSGAETWLPMWQFPEWPTGIRIDLAPKHPEPGQFRFQPILVPVTVRNLNNDPNATF